MQPNLYPYGTNGIIQAGPDGVVLIVPDTHGGLTAYPINSACREMAILVSDEEVFHKKPEHTRQYVRIFCEKLTKYQTKSDFPDRH